MAFYITRQIKLDYVGKDSKFIEASTIEAARTAGGPVGGPIQEVEVLALDSREAGARGFATETTLSAGIKLTGSSRTPLRAGINVSASGDTTIINAPSGTIKIYRIVIQNVSDAAITVSFKNGTSVINGAGLKLDVNQIFERDNTPGFGDLVLSASTAFIINLSDAKAVSGWVEYYVET